MAGDNSASDLKSPIDEASRFCPTVNPVPPLWFRHFSSSSIVVEDRHRTLAHEGTLGGEAECQRRTGTVTDLLEVLRSWKERTGFGTEVSGSEAARASAPSKHAQRRSLRLLAAPGPATRAARS